MDNRNYNKDNRRIDRTEDSRDRHLYRLGELDDYKVASDDPDVRGWTLVGRDRHEIGTINELIVDPDREKVRYLDVVPSRSRPEETGEKHLLIPIGVARLDEKDDRVIVDEIDRGFINSYPALRGESVTRDHEYEVVERFNSLDASSTTRRETADFYDSHLYDEDRFYSTRNRNRG